MPEQPGDDAGARVLSRWRPRHSLLGFLGVVALTGVLLVSCADADEPDDPPGAAPETPTQELDLATKPDMSTVLTDDRGDPPSDLQITELVVGDGQEATAGDLVSVHYVGSSWSSGAQFDASWDRGQPLPFTLGAGEVIEGWDRGVQGMRVGGRRVLIIPPDLAYGDRGAGAVIAPGETLVFVVDLLSVG